MHRTATHLTRDVQDAIDECQHCHSICVATIRHCLDLGGRHAEAGHITLMSDCAQVCTMAANFMLRNSRFQKQITGLCAQVCHACADDCERLDGEDRMMRECAEACRRCASFCERIPAA